MAVKDMVTKKKEKERKKKEYFKTIVSLVQAYPKIIIVGADHVGSKQLGNIRLSLRGKAVILMGKNTKIRKCLDVNRDRLPHADVLKSIVKLNIGFIFCIADPNEVRKVISEHRVPAPARQGVVAPVSVGIPPGPTGMDPSQTNFFQALGISTKIVKGQIEIQNYIDLIKEGTRVTASQSVLLQKLGVKPFSYGLQAYQVYDDGQLYDAKVLDITDDDILKSFSTGVTNLAAMSIGAGFPTEASITHSIIEGFKNLTAVALETGFNFPQMEKIKKMLENPSAFAAPAPAAAAPAAAGVGAKAAEKKAPEPESESEEEGGMLGLFG